MNEFNLKKTKSNRTGLSYILSYSSSEKKVGPVIEKYLDLKQTEFAYYNDESKPKIVFKILNDEGTEYIFNVYGSSGEPFGKSLVALDNCLYIGSFYPKIGFNGIVYRLKEGENVRIQKYSRGLLVDECIDENIFIDFPVVQRLKFECNYDIETKSYPTTIMDEIGEKAPVKNHIKSKTFVAGEERSHLTVLSALSFENENYLLGQYKNGSFNGLVAQFSFDTNSERKVNNFKLLYYVNGRQTGDFIFSYINPSDSGLISRPENGSLKEITEGIQLTFKNLDKPGFHKVTYYNKNVNKEKRETISKDDLESDVKKGIVKRLDVSVLDYKRKIIENYTALSEIKETSKTKVNVVKPKITPSAVLNSGSKLLNDLIGLDTVKTKITNIKNLVKKQKLNPLLKDKKINLSMAFYGNAGTGKTEVARLVAKIFNEEGILPTDKYIETDASGLIAEYVGQSKVKTHKLIQDAMGGVLFIDEAYGLLDGHYGDSKSFGDEAIEALLQDMENYRGQICVILAGYREPMEKMMKSNPGWPSRIKDDMKIDFPSYSLDELKLIAKKLLPPYKMDDECIDEFMKIVELKMEQPLFANAREVRNILEGITSVQATRTMTEFEIEIGAEYDLNITLQDIKDYEHENNIFFGSKTQTIRYPDWVDKNAIYNLLANNIEADIKILNAGEYDQPLLERYRFATVRIEVMTKDCNWTGTGFFISKEGLIATNCHVIDGAERISVKCVIPSSSGDDWDTTVDAGIVFLDHEHDVAIIALLNPKKNCSYIPLKIHDSALPIVPSSVFMYGYPIGKQDIAFIDGKVSSINKETSNSMIEVDLSGKPGNSGSALIEASTGKCIGIFTGAYGKDPNNLIRIAWPIQHLWNLIK